MEVCSQVWVIHSPGVGYVEVGWKRLSRVGNRGGDTNVFRLDSTVVLAGTVSLPMTALLLKPLVVMMLTATIIFISFLIKVHVQIYFGLNDPHQ